MENEVGDTSDFSLSEDVCVRLVLYLWTLRVLDAVTPVQLSSRSSSSLVDRIDSTICINSWRFVSNCFLSLERAWAPSGTSLDRGPHRTSSTSPALGGLLRISVKRAQSSCHLGHTNIVCSTFSSGSTQYEYTQYGSTARLRFYFFNLLNIQVTLCLILQSYSLSIKTILWHYIGFVIDMQKWVRI